MFRKFLPNEACFFDFIEKHASLIVQSTKAFKVLVSPGANIIQQANRIQELEHQADEVTHQCVEALHRIFITPFERNDIYDLISKMDDIIDFIEDTSQRIVVYKLNEMTDGVKELADILVNIMVDLEFTLKGLRKLKEIDLMREKFKQIKHWENKSDTLLRHLIGQLFDHEPDTRTIIKWKEIYENLEDAIDCCEDVSNIIEGVILEKS